jgi:hypothetical protein
MSTLMTGTIPSSWVRLGVNIIVGKAPHGGIQERVPIGLVYYTISYTYWYYV